MLVYISCTFYIITVLHVVSVGCEVARGLILGGAEVVQVSYNKSKHGVRELFGLPGCDTYPYVSVSTECVPWWGRRESYYKLVNYCMSYSLAMRSLLMKFIVMIVTCSACNDCITYIVCTVVVGPVDNMK